MPPNVHGTVSYVRDVARQHPRHSTRLFVADGIIGYRRAPIDYLVGFLFAKPTDAVFSYNLQFLRRLMTLKHLFLLCPRADVSELIYPSPNPEYLDQSEDLKSTTRERVTNSSYSCLLSTFKILRNTHKTRSPCIDRLLVLHGKTLMPSKYPTRQSPCSPEDQGDLTHQSNATSETKSLQREMCQANALKRSAKTNIS